MKATVRVLGLVLALGLGLSWAGANDLRAEVTSGTVMPDGDNSKGGFGG
ncbi:hypothetical protein [Deinococcus planocerae]|nr:hypothetical protein [Deinococcus planocerae]